MLFRSRTQPAFTDIMIDEETSYQVEVIDTWEMTIRDAGIYKGRIRIALPGTEYMAVRLKRIS